MDSARRLLLIERYEEAVRAVLVAIDHVPEAQLDAQPTPGAWSARETVHHLADAEMAEALRLRSMLGENMPVLGSYDEAQYARRLHYDRPIGAAREAFAAVARANIDLLRSLSDDQWKREGIQNRPWRLTVETWLEENVAHVQGHLMQILNAASGGRVIADEA